MGEGKEGGRRKNDDERQGFDVGKQSVMIRITICPFVLHHIAHLLRAYKSVKQLVNYQW